MSDKKGGVILQRLVLRSGKSRNLDSANLLTRELCFCTDTNEYYIGTNIGYIKFDKYELLATDIEIEKTGDRHIISLSKNAYIKFMEELK